MVENKIFTCIKALVENDIKVYFNYTLMGTGEFLKYNQKTNTLTFSDMKNNISYIKPEYFNKYDFEEDFYSGLFSFQKAEVKVIIKDLNNKEIKQLLNGVNE